MDRRKRYSIGTSINLSSPIAESTHYVEDKHLSTQRPKRKQTSPLHSSARSIFKANSCSGLLSRIDPIVYTDAQSNGLASRIVKYHENTHGPHSQPSSSPKSLYDRPGQLPLVHLKKVEIKYVPKRSLSSSSVRIAPPKKSMFQTSSSKIGPLVSMASVILSSTSTLKKPVVADESEKQQTEDEPLTPSSEATTSKSALDALKEISRKRINSEELDVDRYKKQCKEFSEVDGMVEVASGRSVTEKTTTSKRGRETNASAHNNSAENLQKKLCTKNNDILSSLSSSLSEPSMKQIVETVNLQTKKVLSDELSTLGKSVSAVWQPSTIPNQETANVVQKTYSEPVMTTLAASTKAPKLTLFNKKYDQKPIVRQIVDSDEDEDEDRNNFVIPLPKNRSPIMEAGKETLRQVEKSKLSLMLSCLNDEDEVDKPPPVKIVAELKTLNETVAPPKETVPEEPKGETPKEALPVIKEPAKEPQSLQTTFKIPDSSVSINKETIAPVIKNSPNLQLSTANLISFSPSPLEKPKEVSFAPVPTTAATSFPAPQTITLPAPKASMSMTPSIIPKTTQSFDANLKPVTATETTKTFMFEPTVVKPPNEATNTVTATIKLPAKTFSFGESTSTIAATVVSSPMFSSTTLAKDVFGNDQPKITPTVTALPPAYSMPSFTKVDTAIVSKESPLSGIVFGSAGKSAATAAPITSGFSFGQSTVPVSTFGLGTPKSNETQVNRENKPPTFGFGTKPTNATPAPAFSFGGISTAQMNKIDSVSPAPAQFFGAVDPKITPAKTSSFSFGGEKPSVGSGFNFNSFSQQSTPPPSFGKAETTVSNTIATAPQTTTSLPNLFGSQPVQATSIFGQKIADSMEKPASTNIFGATTNSSNLFGAGGLSSTSNNSNLFTAKTEVSGVFGTVSNKPPAYTPPTANTFGSTAVTVKNPPPAFSFGGTDNSQPSQPKNATGFSFGDQSGVPAANNSFSFATGTSNQPPNVFGGGSAMPSTGAGTGFNFSSGSNNNNNSSNNTANSSPFAFKNPNESTFPNVSTGSLAKPAAFNFGGSNVAQPSPNMFGDMSSGSNPMAPMNPFSMVGGGQQQQQPQRRPIRQGMRRLNK